jgi:hypothetical protein
MVNQADEPLVKVTLNLYEADVEYLKKFRHRQFGELVREIIRDWIKELKNE